MEQVVVVAQGIYFLITGIRPILGMKTFLSITGPQTDGCLVKTIRLILAVIGAVLIYAQRAATINPAFIFRAMAGAAALALAEFIHVIQRDVSPVYLGDAFVQLILIGWWILSRIGSAQ